MKKNKKILAMIIMMITILPEMVSATEYLICDEKRFPAVVAQMTSTFLTLIRITVPILLVISGMISFLKVTYSSKVEEEMKKAKSKLVNNIIAAGIIFFIFSITNFAVSLVAGPNNRFMNCAKCFIDLDKCNVQELTDEEIEQGFINPPKEYKNQKDNDSFNEENDEENEETSNENEETTIGDVAESGLSYVSELAGTSTIIRTVGDLAEGDVSGAAGDILLSPVNKAKSGIELVGDAFDWITGD